MTCTFGRQNKGRNRNRFRKLFARCEIKETVAENQPFISQQSPKMKFVSEKIIDNVIEELDSLPDEVYETQMAAFSEAQPMLTAYLFNEENFHLLTEDEHGYLQYLALIAWKSMTKVNGPGQPASEEAIGEAEEKNYEVLEASTAKNFRDRLDPFFENYPQEDLLAFAEEAVLEEENDPESLVTKEGREPIFIAMKTMIDVLISSN